MKETRENQKHFLPVRLLPTIFLTVVSFVFSFCYTDLSFASENALLHCSFLFGLMAILLLLDVGLELAYRGKENKRYHFLSLFLAIFEMLFCIISLLCYFLELRGEEVGKRILPASLLMLLAAINLLYRLMIYFGKWKTEEKKGNDLVAAYIGLSGLGNALLASLSFSAVLCYAGKASYGYVGIFTYLALGGAFLEALLGLFWLSWEKIRSSSKSNLFFYLTIFNFFASVAMLIVAIFAKSYELISYQVTLWCCLPGGAMALLWGALLSYLAYLGKK